MNPVEIVRDEPGPEKKLRPVPDPEPSSTYVKWENPPEMPIPTRLQRVTAELQRRPGEWALIAAASSPLMGWWRPLVAHPDFEVTTVFTKPEETKLLSPRDVYARYARVRMDNGAPRD